MDVPAETLPVRGPTAFVAVMPVPASPSGRGKHDALGQHAIEAGRTGGGQACLPGTPAGSTCGSRSRSVKGCSAMQARQTSPSCRGHSRSVSLSMGNMPEASPMPTAFTPVSI